MLRPTSGLLSNRKGPEIDRPASIHAVAMLCYAMCLIFSLVYEKVLFYQFMAYNQWHVLLLLLLLP